MDVNNQSINRNQSVSAQRLRQLLRYEPETGDFVWLLDRPGSAKAGVKAGCPSTDGYTRISVDGVRYFAHRLAWLYVYGEWPRDEIDHINQVKNDNRLCNLREVNSSENKQNTFKKRHNTSGYKGVSLKKKSGKWYSGIRINGRRRHLGYFNTPEEAAAAYKAAAAALHSHRPLENS